jgi:hypothetical protein
MEIFKIIFYTSLRRNTHELQNMISKTITGLMLGVSNYIKQSPCQEANTVAQLEEKFPALH